MVALWLAYAQAMNVPSNFMAQAMSYGHAWPDIQLSGHEHPWWLRQVTVMLRRDHRQH